MEILENLYEFEIKKLDFIERKIDIPPHDVHLFGPPWSGKSYILFNYLSYMDPKNYIYIDMHDMRLGTDTLGKLPAFLEKNPITTVVFDNWDGEESYLPAAQIQLICLSREPYPSDLLEALFVPPLDFEEYILFENVPTSQITQTFNNFLKFGTLPYLVRDTHELKPMHIQNLLHTIYPNETLLALFVHLIKATGLAFTHHQIFQNLKKERKISKDKFYYYMENLTRTRTILLLPKYGQPNAAKKVYAYDFALRDGVTFEKSFTNVYENMILVELAKNFEAVYYIGLIDFYMPHEKLGIIAMPFSSRAAVRSLLDKLPKEAALKRLEIITMGYEDMFMFDNVEVEILPYWTWALKDEK